MGSGGCFEGVMALAFSLPAPEGEEAMLNSSVADYFGTDGVGVGAGVGVVVGAGVVRSIGEVDGGVTVRSTVVGLVDGA